MNSSPPTLGLETDALASKTGKSDGEVVVQGKEVPPDGGWGWAVEVGVVIANLLILGHLKSFGVYFTPLMERYDATPSQVAWIPAIQIAVMTFMAPVGSILAQKISPRQVTVIGGIVACVGLVCSSQAGSIKSLYFTYGVLGGLASVMCFTPGVMMISCYFHRRRGLGNGIAMAGNTAGGMILPIVADKLLYYYDLSGELLIMGSLMLHACAGAMLWQPVEWHMKTEYPNAEAFKDKLLSQPPITPVTHSTSHTGNNVNSRTVSCAIDINIIGERQRSSSVDDIVINSHTYDIHFSPKTAMEGQETSYNEEERIVDFVSEDRKIQKYHLRPTSSKQDSPYRHCTRRSSRCALPYKRTPLLIAQSVDAIHGLERNVVETTESVTSLNYLSTFYLGPSSSAVPVVEELSEENSGLHSPSECVQAIQNEYNSRLRIPRRVLVFVNKIRRLKYIDTSFFSDSRFYVLVFSMGFHQIGYAGTQNFLPLHAEKILGLTHSQAATLLTAVAFADLIGRVGCAWLSDYHIFPRKYWYMIGQFLSGVFAFLLQFTDEYVPLLACSAAFGLASGSYIGLIVVLFADVFGPEKAAHSHSLAIALCGFPALGGLPFLGKVLYFHILVKLFFKEQTELQHV
ncbi:uncharacterized protein LOC143244288 isoform X3 [Tachypleus tridentatus]|uniref:uncharacterized protein LOC143244288 isoform X3 n=1 Tax=Tachypleus tridentatus TaxID=6853 RepID=UPI003FD42528